MGIVTDYLIDQLKQQVNERGVVVWFDPQKTYAELAASLDMPETHIARFTSSYLELRHSVDDRINDIQSEKPPRLLLYVPLERSETRHILDEFIYAGRLMQPGEPLPRNTSLVAIARGALRTRFARERLDEIEHDILKGRIKSLDELDRLADQGDTGALALIFGTGQPSEIAQKFVFSDSYDPELVAREALDLLAGVLMEYFGITLPEGETPAQMRSRMSKALLVIEFCLQLDEKIPPALTSIPLPEASHHKENCLEFVENWRNRRDLQQIYTDIANNAERDLTLDDIELTLDALIGVKTFAYTERKLQACVEEVLIESPDQRWVELAQNRRSDFWSETDEQIGTHWALITAAGGVLIKAKLIQQMMRDQPPSDASEFIQRYTDEKDPWCQLDTLHRNLEKLAIAMDYSPAYDYSSLEMLLARGRQDYARTVDELARKFIGALALANFSLGGVVYQNEVFKRYVAPAMREYKVAYFLVDALRYEMALDLAASLDRDWNSKISPAVAIPPTITSIGMGALLPGAEKGVSLTQVGDLAPQIGGQILKNRRDRMNYLAQKIPDLYELKLDALLPAKKTVREALTAAKFILVTSQEIDLLGEGDNLVQGREFMDSVLAKLARSFRVLIDHGVERIIVVSDHGYIFSDELDSDQTIPAPGGQTVDLHRRVWVGRGGQALDGVLRISTEALNLGGDLELATPVGLVCFAASGGKAYFHGGMSLQEMIIPVLILEPEAVVQPSQIEWVLVPGRDKITTRFFSVQVAGTVPSRSMFDGSPPLVRLEVRIGNKSVSTPVTATYGLQEATGELQMRWSSESAFDLEPNTVALMLTGEISQKQVSVHLIDAETEKSLIRLRIQVAISI